MSEPVPRFDDPEGEAALDRDIELLRRRRRIGWAAGLSVIAAMATVLLWPKSACEQLAQDMCQKGLLHCGRSRDAIKGELDDATCEALGQQAPHAAADALAERFPELGYTEVEQEQIREHPRQLPGVLDADPRR